MKNSIVKLMMDTIHSYECEGIQVSRIQLGIDLYTLLRDDMEKTGICKSLQLYGVWFEPNDYLVGFNMKVFEYTEREIKD